MANVFETCTGSFVGGMLWVLNKADLLSGASPRQSVYGPLTGYYSMFPVHSIGSTTTQYLVRTIAPRYVRLYALIGVPPGNVDITSVELPVQRIGYGVDAVQQGTSYTLEVGDTRVRDAMWKDGRLWLGFNDACVPAGDSVNRTCFRLIEIDTTSGTILQDFDVGAANTYYYFPAMRTDRAGNLLVVFGFSSSTAYPSVGVTYRAPSDPLNALQPPVTVRAGTGPETPATGWCTAGVCRFGDYSGAGTDPTDPSVVWTASEYGSSSGWATYVSAVRVRTPMEANLTLSYSVQGGGTGYQPPTLSYTYNGTSLTAILTTTPTAYAMDFGSLWSVTDALGGSTASERWSASQPTSGTVMSSTTIAFVYYHQVGVTFAYQVSAGGSGYAAPSVTYAHYGAQASGAMDSPVWADAGGAYAYPAALPGSTSNEAWHTNSATGTVAATGTITGIYVHQYSITFAFGVTGGGSGYTAPTVGYVQFGAPLSGTASFTAWVDAGSSYAYPELLTGSGPTQRWKAVASGGTVAAAGTVTVTYVHQFTVSFAYSVIGGGTGYNAPRIAYADLTLPASTMPSTLVWADSGSVYQFENPLPGSTTTEGWRTKDGTGTIGSATTYAATYRHQYRVRFSVVSSSGLPTGEAPLVNVTQFGTTVALPADSVDWVDAGGAYAFPAAFYGPLAGERWIASTAPTGTVTGPTDVTATYVHQFFLTIQMNAAAGGTVTGSSGWYNESTFLTLQASATIGWRFEGWIGSGNGSYSGSSSTATITMNAPITESAVFYVGLTLRAGDGGSIAYAYGGTNGWVPPGSAETLYVAPGTTITITATPSAFHEFHEWSGDASGVESSITVTMERPIFVSGSFGVSFFSRADSILGIGLFTAAALALAAVGFRRRRRRRVRALRAVETRGIRL